MLSRNGIGTSALKLANLYIYAHFPRTACTRIVSTRHRREKAPKACRALTHHAKGACEYKEKRRRDTSEPCARQTAVHELHFDESNGHQWKILSLSKERARQETHVVIQTLDDSGIDEDAGGDTVEDTNRQERRARVWVVSRVDSHADGDPDRGDELQREGNRQSAALLMRNAEPALTPKAKDMAHFFHPLPAGHTS